MISMELVKLAGSGVRPDRWGWVAPKYRKYKSLLKNKKETKKTIDKKN